MDFLEKSYIGKNKWYLYLVVLFLTFVICQVGGIPFGVYQLLSQPEILDAAKTGEQIDQASLATPADNVGLALMLLSFVVGLLAFFQLAKAFQNKKATDITTGRKRFDWGRVLFGILIWGVLTVIVSSIEISMDSDITYAFDWTKFLPLLVVGLLMFPFQTGFEEVIFRGYLMQGTARLFKYRWVALLITSVLFGLMHGMNPEIETYGMEVAMPQYIIMGLILGYISVKDGGIELAFGMHFINNLLSSVIVTSDGQVFKTAAIFSDASPAVTHMDTVAILVAGVIFILVCNRKYDFFSKVSLWKKIESPEKKEKEMEDFTIEEIKNV